VCCTTKLTSILTDIRYHRTDRCFNSAGVFSCIKFYTLGTLVLELTGDYRKRVDGFGRSIHALLFDHAAKSVHSSTLVLLACVELIKVIGPAVEKFNRENNDRR
jgi:hypothetical protein